MLATITVQFEAMHTKSNADADYMRKRCKQDLRSWNRMQRTRIMMQFEWDNYGLSAHGPTEGIRDGANKIYD